MTSVDDQIIDSTLNKPGDFLKDGLVLLPFCSLLFLNNNLLTKDSGYI